MLGDSSDGCEVLSREVGEDLGLELGGDGEKPGEARRKRRASWREGGASFESASLVRLRSRLPEEQMKNSMTTHYATRVERREV